MESFSYVDIFATKGIEYILVIGFLVAFILFSRLLSSSEKPERTQSRASARHAPGWFAVPEGVYYHQGHTWAIPENDEVVRIGIDDFAQKLIGKPKAIRLPQVGATLSQAQKAWKLQVNGKAVEVLSPVSGKVIAVNEAVEQHPELVNEDPYRQGWLLKVKDRHLAAELKNLLSGKLAKTWMRETEHALRRKMYGDLAVALPDGGVPISGIARSLDPQNWDKLAKEFLLSD